jgi:GNAT superfamily N-acetyltransferase
VEARVATRRDLDGVTETLWLAFADDPTWRWAFPEHEQLRGLWHLLVSSALRYPWVWIMGDYAAAAVWIPPHGTELTTDEEEQLEPLLDRLAGARAHEVMELMERFDASHPHGEPHYYLTLLGTHPDHRGRGIGMGLLSQNLARIDEEGAAAYLESTNPVNNRRYEGVGFERRGEFRTPGEEHPVATMWRPGVLSERVESAQ